jgi:hypothetical protein
MRIANQIMRQGTRENVFAVAFAGFIALSISVAMMFWDPQRPVPERAVAIICGWCGGIATVALVFAWFLRRWQRPDDAGPAHAPDVPPEPSPVAAPLGPRRPAPLVARAVPDRDESRAA